MLEAMQQALEFFSVSDNPVINLLWFAFCLWFSYVAITEPYKYFKDCFYLGTFSWTKQYRCRRAMEYRHACLGALTIYLDEDVSTYEAKRKELLELAALWDNLVVADSYTGDSNWFNGPKRTPNLYYNSQWHATLAKSNDSQAFRLGLSVFKRGLSGGSIYNRYGYQL